MKTRWSRSSRVASIALRSTQPKRRFTQVQVLRLLDVRMPPRVGHLFRPARRRRALLLRLLLVSVLSLGNSWKEN